MIDVLYIVGPQDELSEKSLRWSLRSLAKYGTGVGRVIVSGYPPDWLAPCVDRFRSEDRGEPHKFARIWRTLFDALDAGLVSGDFVMAHDDNYYTKPLAVDETPLWYRKDELPTIDCEVRGGRNYRISLAATRQTLLDAGYGIVDAANHCNMRFSTDDADECRRLWRESRYPDAKSIGLDLGVMFYNVRMKRAPFVGTYRKDRKVFNLTDDDIKSGQFSSDARTFADKKFVNWFD